METTKTGYKKCGKCGGSGTFKSLTLYGPCFSCNGRGVKPTKAQAKIEAREAFIASLLQASDGIVAAEKALSIQGISERAARGFRHSLAFHNRNMEQLSSEVL